MRKAAYWYLMWSPVGMRLAVVCRNGDIILRADKDVTASPDEVWKAINAERSEKRESLP
jgi:hypothetical protein